MEELVEDDSQAHAVSEESQESLQERSSLKTIHDLPDEMVCHIFSFLELRDILRVKRVCERWRSIADYDSLWKKLTLWSGDFASTRRKVSLTIKSREEIDLVKACPKLQWVKTLDGYNNDESQWISADVLKAVATYCPDLRGILEISYGKDASAITTVMRQCPNLESLDVLWYISGPDTSVNLFADCINLKKLFLSWRSYVPGLCGDIARGCPMLQSLNLWNCDYDHSELSHLLQKIGHQIKELAFQCCRTDSQKHCVFPDIAQCCTSLEVLGIRNHEGPHAFLKGFLESEVGRNLRELELSDFEHVDEDFCTALFKNCTNLTRLWLVSVGLGNNHMTCIGELRNLKYLAIVGNFDTTVLTNIAQCKTLIHLHVGKLTTNECSISCHPVLPNLQILDAKMTSEFLLLVPKYFNKLRQLLINLRHMDEEAVKQVKACMPHLMILERSGVDPACRFISPRF